MIARLAARILGRLLTRPCVAVDDALAGWDDEDEVSCQ